MSCYLYHEAPDLGFDPYDSCERQADPNRECRCLEDKISSILGTPGFPKSQWSPFCWLYYEYEKSEICPAYKKGSDFRYEGICTMGCTPLSPNPCDPYDGSKTLPVGDFETDRKNIAERMQKAARKQYEQEIEPIEFTYESRTCLLELYAEVDYKNNTDIEILLGCKAPWEVYAEDSYRDFTSEVSLKCLTCSYTQRLPRYEFRTRRSPEWKGPAPGCSPPPPPPPSPTPPPQPKPPGNCLNGGGSSDLPSN